MITDSYDDKSPAKINVKKNENAVHVDAVIYTFSEEIEKYVVAHYDCEKVGEYAMACGSTSVYLLKYHGKRFGFYRTWVGAPACIGPIEELSTVLDTDKIIHYGGAGCLNKEITRGKVMIPTEAYRDEGTSYHYLPPGHCIEISEKARNAIEKALKAHGLPYTEVVTWSTDGFYRETREKTAKRISEGCTVVEMECSALAACAALRGAVWGELLYTADTLADAGNYDERSWGSNAADKALELCVEAVRNI